MASEKIGQASHATGNRRPWGCGIIGTSDTILAVALISGIGEDGEPEYAGESDINWDSQETREREGKTLFVCADGEEWTFDQLKPGEPEDEDEDDSED